MSTSEYSSESPESNPSSSVDSDQVQRAKREIQTLIQEIAEMSRTDISTEEFYDAMLNKLVVALAAPGGAVWTMNDTGVLQLTYQINIRETGLLEDEVGQRQHGKLINQVLQGTEGTVVAPHSGAGDATADDPDAAANSTGFLLVLAPVLNDQGPQGVIEIFQRPGARPATQRGYLRFLQQTSRMAGDFLKGHRLRHLAEKQTLWEQLETFTRTAHQKLNVRETAYTIVNEGRRLIGCDRVSVAICHGSRCPIEAISGQDTFDKRSNVSVMLGKLAAAVTKTGEDVWYTGDASNLAPQVEEALDAYIDESHTKAISILPLFEHIDDEEPAEDEESKPPKVIGALIVEQMVANQPPEGFLQRVDVVRSHSATALANALEHEGLFLMPVWRAIGKSMGLFRGRTLPKTLAVIAAVVALLLFACFYPTDFTLEGQGNLRPKTRQNIFARLDGDVQSVKVDHDSQVQRGQLLVVQRSLDLEKEMETIHGQLGEALADIQSTERETTNSEQLSVNEENQKIARIAQLEMQAISLREQLKLLETKQEMLNIRSPIDGTVITWKVHEQLENRPVSRGQVLMEVADPSGDWELEVTMPEARMGHIAKAWTSSEGNLPVTFILTTDPSIELEGHVVEIHRSAEVRGEEGNTVLLRVTFDQDMLREKIGNPKIGAEAIAKVHCGTAPIGYVYLHDLVDFVRAKILFRI